MLAAASAASHLLVVAPKEWTAIAEAFAAEKRALPWIASCEVASVEALQEGQSGDEAERLKRGLFARWSLPGKPRFDSVLFVGDMHVLPTRYMMLDRVTKAACDVAFYPSDLYFADLTDDAGAFEDWNARIDGIHGRYIGEVHGEAGKSGPIDADGCGLVPEIAVGRWPVATSEEAKAVAEKSLRHERAVEAARRAGADGAEPGSPAWLACPISPALVVACGEWIDNQARITAVADRLKPAFSVACLTYFDSDPARRPDSERVSAAMHAGTSLILHTGHGEPDGWQHGLRAADLPKSSLADRACLPVVLSIGCSTAVVAPQPPYEPYRDADGIDHQGTNAGEVFESPPPPPACLQPRKFAHASIGAKSVTMPSGGAVAYIGCTTGSQPCAHTLLDEFARALADQPSAAAGEAWKHSLTRYVTLERLRELTPSESWYPPSIYFQPMKFIFLGDPSVRIR